METWTLKPRFSIAGGRKPRLPSGNCDGFKSKEVLQLSLL
ncbi:rCG54548 [Rattus norvegicus]|uniref:RCG54548 n=1 Tax=Rattus norvegicus TaxID=10116 RepID=A6JA31_RAT|nr:rCG54548 [Rattus norvegicus]